MLDTGRCFSPLGGYPPGVYSRHDIRSNLIRVFRPQTLDYQQWSFSEGSNKVAPTESPNTVFKARDGPPGRRNASFHWRPPLVALRVVRCLSAFFANRSLLSAWCAASPLSVRTPHSSPRGALPLRFLCEPLTPLRVQLFSLFPPHSKRVPPRPPSRPAMTRPRQALLAQSGGSYSLSAAGNPGY